MSEPKVAVSNEPIKDRPKRLRKAAFMFGIFTFWSIIAVELLCLGVAMPLILGEVADPEPLTMEGTFLFTFDDIPPEILSFQPGDSLQANITTVKAGEPSDILISVEETNLEQAHIELTWDDGPTTRGSVLEIDPYFMAAKSWMVHTVMIPAAARGNLTVSVQVMDISKNTAHRSFEVPIINEYLDKGYEPPLLLFETVSQTQYINDALVCEIEQVGDLEPTFTIYDNGRLVSSTQIIASQQDGPFKIGQGLVDGTYEVEIEWISGSNKIGQQDFTLIKDSVNDRTINLRLDPILSDFEDSIMHGHRPEGTFYPGETVRVSWDLIGVVNHGLGPHSAQIDLFGKTYLLSQKAIAEQRADFYTTIPKDPKPTFSSTLTDVFGNQVNSSLDVDVVTSTPAGMVIDLGFEPFVGRLGIGVSDEFGVTTSILGSMNLQQFQVDVVDGFISPDDLTEVLRTDENIPLVINKTLLASASPYLPNAVHLRITADFHNPPSDTMFLVSPIFPFIHALPITVTGPAFVVWVIFLAAAVVGSIAYFWVQEGKDTIHRIKHGFNNRMGPTINSNNGSVILPQVFASNLFFNGAIIGFIFVVMGTASATPARLGPEAAAWDLAYIFLHASVYEEIIVRFLYLGVPLCIFTLAYKGFKKEKILPKQDVLKTLLGGTDNFGNVEIALIIISALIFALAHVPSWDWYKAIPTFIGGLFMGYLFIKKGIHASIILHFAIDYLGMFATYLSKIYDGGDLTELDPNILALVAVMLLVTMIGIVMTGLFLGILGPISLSHYVQRPVWSKIKGGWNWKLDRQCAVWFVVANMVINALLLVIPTILGFVLPPIGYLALISSTILLALGLVLMLFRKYIFAAPVLFLGCLASLPIGFLGSVAFFHCWRILRVAVGKFYLRPLPPDDFVGESKPHLPAGLLPPEEQ